MCFGIGNDELNFANCGIGHHGLAEEGLSVKQRSELLGHKGTAYRAKASAVTTAKNQVNHFLLP